MKVIPIRKRDGTLRAGVMVDDDVFEELSRWRWQLSRNRYAHRTTSSPKRSIYMHRYLMGLEHGDPRHVDHINRNTFDNRKSNLRIVTRAQQAQNLTAIKKTSHYRGVSYYRGKWKACVTVAGKQHYLGLYEDEEVAARVAAGFRAKHMTHSEDAADLYRVNVEGGGSFLYDLIDVGRFAQRMASEGDTRAFSIQIEEAWANVG